jgi:hypothetical protein
MVNNCEKRICKKLLEAANAKLRTAKKAMVYGIPYILPNFDCDMPVILGGNTLGLSNLLMPLILWIILQFVQEINKDLSD